jgi:hypothetical protein
MTPREPRAGWYVLRAARLWRRYTGPPVLTLPGPGGEALRVVIGRRTYLTGAEAAVLLTGALPSGLTWRRAR